MKDNNIIYSNQLCINVFNIFIGFEYTISL